MTKRTPMASLTTLCFICATVIRRKCSSLFASETTRRKFLLEIYEWAEQSDAIFFLWLDLHDRNHKFFSFKDVVLLLCIILSIHIKVHEIRFSIRSYKS